MNEQTLQSRASLAVGNAASTAALGLIKAYQYGVRPMLGQRCRFFPSCSEYTAEAIGEYGVFRGASMGAMRLAKCHPWHAGGYDPVLPRASRATEISAGAPTGARSATVPSSAHPASPTPN